MSSAEPQILTNGSTPPATDGEIAAVVERLSWLQPVAYSRERKPEAERLGISVTALDAEVKLLVKAHEAKETADAKAQAQAEKEEQEAPQEPEGWLKFLQIDEHGQFIPNLANALTAFRDAPELQGIVAYDLMQRNTLICRRLPASNMKGVTDKRPIQDADVSVFQEFLQRNQLRKIGKEVTHQAVELIAREHAFHPVVDYLNGLHWDGKPRLDTWLTYYLGAEKQPKEYLASIGRWFWISMVARILRPGCKCDYMIVFEDQQGTHKSTACGVLAGEWFDDSLPELHGGDEVRISMHLRGKRLIEISELSSVGKSEASALKSFLTRREERYTPKFGRNEVIEPRQCVFAGTTNQAAYLRDETGDRRTWPVKTGTIDLDALIADRDQLFAEAVVAFQAGERYWPDKEFEAEHIKPEQEKRFVADEWESIIRTWVQTQGRTKATISELAKDALYLDTPKLGTADQRRITIALTRMGWGPKRDQHGRWWELVTVANDSTDGK